MAYKDNETMRKQNIKYLNTESGFIISKWNDIKKPLSFDKYLIFLILACSVIL